MFWIIYFLSSLALSHLIGSIFFKHYLEIFCLCLILFITPTQIDLSDFEVAPAMFTFLFNIIFEKEFSLRPLRPILLTISPAILFLLLYNLIKKRFV